MADQFLLAAAGAHDEGQLHMSVKMFQHHHHHLQLTAANNFDQHQRHERASSVTSDQYSSLNLSSIGSSAHHSPILEHDGDGDGDDDDHHHHNHHHQHHHHHHLRHLNLNLNLNHHHPHEQQLDEGAFNRLTLAAAALDDKAAANGNGHSVQGTGVPPPGANSLTSSSALSDYHSSTPCSPVDSIGSPPNSVTDDLLLLASPSDQPHATLVLSDHTSLVFEGHHQSAGSDSIQANSGDNADNNHKLQQDAHRQKMRSFSHSTSFSPLVSAAATADSEVTKSPSKASSKSTSQAVSALRKAPEPEANHLYQAAPHQEPVVDRPRRLSRIENRQSLHDLGYGRIESYFKLQRLGKGTYATVYMGRSRLNNDLVALKEILKEHDEGAPCTAIREVSLLRLLRHNNIVTLHDICHTPKKLTLVFEYVGPDLYAYMKENNHLLSIHNVRLLLYQLLRGIAFCHSRQVLHRDLKPQNLLINSRGELKICDFGLARAKSIPTKSYSNEVVTLWYRPPDVLLGNTDYDHSIDMWGVGCIFYEMAAGRTFFPGSSVRQQLYLIFSSLGAPTQGNWPEILTNPEYLSYSFPPFKPEKLAHRVPRLDADAVQLLQSFLRYKPSERISADEARRDAFFACLPERVHHLNERESIFDVPGVYMTSNPGQKLNHNHHHHHYHNHHQHHHH